MFLKIKNGDRWGKSREMHSEFLELKAGVTSTVNYVSSRMGLTRFYEIKAKIEVMNKHKVFS
jgi:hypothetical protein